MGVAGAHTEFKRPAEFTAAVVLYVTDTCGFCRMAEALLRRRQIPFEAVDVTHSSEARTWLVQATRQRTVPQIFIKQRSIGGYTELAALERTGKLDALLA
jgi:glutaredoxin 3